MRPFVVTAKSLIPYNAPLIITHVVASVRARLGPPSSRWRGLDAFSRGLLREWKLTLNLGVTTLNSHPFDVQLPGLLSQLLKV
jgi:hypothetical protein